MSSAERLYTPELLGWAVKLAEYRKDNALSLEGNSRSPSCGSTLSLSLDLDEQGTIADLAMRVSACAVGQASAAIFAEKAKGKSRANITDALSRMEAWLGGEGDMPDWPDLAIVAPARDFPARHGAMLLPWKAAEDALSKAQVAG